MLLAARPPPQLQPASRMTAVRPLAAAPRPVGRRRGSGCCARAQASDRAGQCWLEDLAAAALAACRRPTHARPPSLQAEDLQEWDIVLYDAPDGSPALGRVSQVGSSVQGALPLPLCGAAAAPAPTAGLPACPPAAAVPATIQPRQIAADGSLSVERLEEDAVNGVWVVEHGEARVAAGAVRRTVAADYLQMVDPDRVSNPHGGWGQARGRQSGGGVTSGWRCDRAGAGLYPRARLMPSCALLSSAGCGCSLPRRLQRSPACPALPSLMTRTCPSSPPPPSARRACAGGVSPAGAGGAGGGRRGGAGRRQQRQQQRGSSRRKRVNQWLAAAATAAPHR